MGRVSDFLSFRLLIHLLILRPTLKLLFGAGVDGREHLRGLDRFMLVANHNSHLDVLLIFQALPPRAIRNTHPVAAHEYFSRSKILFGLVDYLFQPVWIVRGNTRSDPLEGMRERLRQGHSIVIFPEGTRGAPGEIAPFRAGVGKLATEFPGTPIVPVFLAGVEKALPKASALPVPMWTRAIVGPPQLRSGSRKDITAALEAMVRELAASEMGQQHRRINRPREIPVIAALGIDGSGKSTLSRSLAQRLSKDARVCLVTDDVVFYEEGELKGVQPLLRERVREAINRRAKTAGSLKGYKAPKLAELLLRDHVAGEVRRWYAPDAIVMDGSPLLNMTAWTKLYKEEAFNAETCASILMALSEGGEELPDDDPVYQTFHELVTLRRLHLAGLKRPDVVLFLDIDPAVSMERIRSRGETQQVHETEEKLTRLREGYRMVCDVVEGKLGIPARILDGSGSIEEVADAAVKALGEIEIPGLRSSDMMPQGGNSDG
jgi:1-acyl-sn-glycerol-3-phosphate acyltransferase